MGRRLLVPWPISRSRLGEELRERVANWWGLVLEGAGGDGANSWPVLGGGGACGLKWELTTGKHLWGWGSGGLAGVNYVIFKSALTWAERGVCGLVGLWEVHEHCVNNLDTHC